MRGHSGSRRSMSVEEVFKVCFWIQEIRAKLTQVQTVQDQVLKGLLKICVTNEHSALQEYSIYAAIQCATYSQAQANLHSAPQQHHANEGCIRTLQGTSIHLTWCHRGRGSLSAAQVYTMRQPGSLS